MFVRFPDTHPTAVWAIRTSLLAAVAACMFGGGCVRRRMTIISNPPGALVYVDDYEIGTTPVSTDFVYYGTRKLRLVKDGYETLTVMQDIPPPWYEIPPIDFVAENFVPGHIRDQRVLDYQLRPQAVVPTEQLLSRAEQLRRGVHATAAAQPTAGPEVIPTPEGVGGRPIHRLPPR